MSFKIISVFLSGTMVKWNCCGPCGSDAPPPQRREWFKVSLSALWLVSQVWPRPDKVGSSATPWRTSAARRSVGVSSYLIFQDKRNYGGYTSTDFSLIWEVFVYHWVRTPQIWTILFYKLCITYFYQNMSVWINAVWIFLFAIFNVAISNYSEDQCSWRGRWVPYSDAFPKPFEWKRFLGGKVRKQPPMQQVGCFICRLHLLVLVVAA